MSNYKKGLYKYKGHSDYIDLIIYDGEHWWVPGWEIGLKLAINEDEVNSHFFVEKEEIGEFLWEYGDLSNNCTIITEGNDEVFEIDITSCCGAGPIVNENYCPNCGKKIIK